jgi:thiol-disulfide isomerase/thioredoxin
MSDQPKVEGRESPAAGGRGYGVWAAIALAVVGAGAALYLQGTGAGKGAAAPMVVAVSALKGLNTGEMAAFLIHDAPKATPAVTFKDGDGKDQALEAWRGKVVLVNMWATWCVPCRHEMPALDRLKAELGGKDFDVLALSGDRGGLDKPRKFWADTGIKALGLYTGGSDVQNALGVIGLPTTLLLDRTGREIGRLVGPAEWASPEAKALLQAAIKG